MSVLLAIGVSIWAFQSYAAGEGGLMLAFGALCIAIGAGLILYLIRFLRKLKHVSYV